MNKPTQVLFIHATGAAYQRAESLANEMASYMQQLGLRADNVDQGLRYDLAIAVGGDGTMMKVVTQLAARSIPVLGINAGGVGFLTSADASGWRTAMPRILSGDYSVEERLGLSFQLDQDEQGPIANEVVLRHQSSVATFEVSIGGQVFYSSLTGDGVMVATATGSTGYNTSAGGPILLPSSENVVVTALNPTSLTTRPLVCQELAEGGEVVLKLVQSKRDEPVSVIADGKQNSTSLKVGEVVVVRKHQYPLRFATFGLEQYATALTEKKGFAR